MSKERPTLTRRELVKGLAVSGIIPFLPQELLPPEPPKSKDKEVSFISSVLMYHEVTASRLRSDVMGLIRSGYMPISSDQFANILNGQEDTPTTPTFMVTCDDGLLSQYTQGLPALETIAKETGIIVPMTLFSIMKFENLDGPLDQMSDIIPSFSDGTHKYMTKAQLIEMIRRGNNVENHTVNHLKLNQLTEEARNFEVEYAEKRINELWDIAGVERSTRIFAYPFGVYNGQEGYLGDLGFDTAFTTERQIKHDSVRKFRQGRVRET